jgi:hypothetical protein
VKDQEVEELLEPVGLPVRWAPEVVGVMLLGRVAVVMGEAVVSGWSVGGSISVSKRRSGCRGNRTI